jgi:hypothetical protein
MVLFWMRLKSNRSSAGIMVFFLLTPQYDAVKIKKKE